MSVKVVIDTSGSDEVVRNIRRVAQAREVSVQQALGTAQRGRALDRVLWTATGITLGIALATWWWVAVLEGAL